MTQHNTKQSKFSHSLAALLGWFGLCWSALVILFFVVLPFVWSPLLKQLSIYKDKNFLLAAGIGALLSPFLMLGGFSWMSKPSFSRLLRILRKTLGVELLLLSTFWLIFDIFQLSQHGWGAMRPGYTFIFSYPGILIAPLLLGFGFALLSQNTLRDIIGLTLTVTGYQSLLLLGLFRLFISQARNFVPMLAANPSTVIISSLTAKLATYASAGLFAGILFMKGPLRLRSHLVLSFPIWLPFFIIFFFWSLIVDTTFYFFEDLFGTPFQPPTPIKILLAPLCLILFPLLLTLDFSVGLMRLLGHGLLSKLFPPEQQTIEAHQKLYTTTRIYALGAALLFTLPLWGPPLLIYGAIRLFIYESILMHVIGRRAFSLPEDSYEGKSPSEM